jgi:hypothetical protein
LVNYAGGSVTLTASATNFVYLDTTASCVPAVSPTTFALSTQVPLYVVTTSSSTVTAISDVKTMFQKPSTGSSTTIPPNVTLTGTPSAGQVPTATGPTAATWQTPASGTSGILTQSLANDSSVGTATGLLACYTNVNLGLVGTCSTTQSGVQGTNGNVPWAGVCISGCGTTGFATIQYAGPVSWICDDSVNTSADAVQPSITNAGECHQPVGESNPIPNENPESNSFFGLPAMANSGAGTAAIINLIDFPFSRFAFPLGGIVMSQGGSSPFLTISHLGQQTSTYTIPFALTGNGLATTQVAGNGNSNTNYGLSTFGTSGRDTVLDSISNGFGEPPTEMLALVGSQYQIPAGTTPGTDGNGATFTPPSISGTWAPGGISGDFCVGGTSGMYIIRLAGNTTQGPAQPNIEGQGCDNPGHVIYFEIMPPSSGGPFTLTWASNFVNPPTVSLSSGASPVLASFLFDGANYNCIIGCAGSGSGVGGAMTQIAQAVVTTATPTVTFSSIPGNFTNLEIRATAMETGSAGEDLKINFNGDNTSGNYSYAFYPIQETGSSTNGANLGHFCFNQNTTNPAMCTIQINGYSSSVFTKLYTSTNYVGEIGIGNLLLFQGLWGNTNPITSIVIGVDGANNLAPGTTFTLYGLQ